jgi:hypothetical protein
MPKKYIHSMVGAIAGGGAAFHFAREQNEVNRLIETTGGVLAGWLGGRAPDLIEPAIHPNHRSTFHAVLPVSATGMAIATKISEWQGSLRELAKRQSDLALAAEDPLLSLLHKTAEVLFLLLAGALVGFTFGYASHVMLDLFTPKGLPILC